MNRATVIHTPTDTNDFEYRPLSTGAIASAIFGILSWLLFVVGGDSLYAALLLTPLPLLGVVTGGLAWKKIRSMPNQLSGQPAALAGLILSTIGLLGGLGYASVVHATEVPEGYTRISFHKLRPDQVEERGGKVIPPDIQSLDQQRVFVKGYMRPGTHRSHNGTPVRKNVNMFLLVRDNNQCCFGDLADVKYYDQIAVKLAENRTTDYAGGLFRLGGKLIIHPHPTQHPQRPVYSLEADYIQ